MAGITKGTRRWLGLLGVGLILVQAAILAASADRDRDTKAETKPAVSPVAKSVSYSVEPTITLVGPQSLPQSSASYSVVPDEPVTAAVVVSRVDAWAVLGLE